MAKLKKRIHKVMRHWYSTIAYYNIHLSLHRTL